MSLIHQSAKDHYAKAKTALVKGDRVPGGGTVTQVMRELGGNAYYVQWDGMSWEEGPYSLQELKSGEAGGATAKRARKTASDDLGPFVVVNTDTEEILAGPFSSLDEAGEAMNDLNPPELGLSGPYYNGFDVPLAVAVDDDKWRTAVRKQAWHVSDQHLSGVCASGDHDECRMDHVDRSMCLCGHGFHGGGVPPSWEASRFSEMTGACGDNDHSACRQSHIQNYGGLCLCPDDSHDAGGKLSKKAMDGVDSFTVKRSIHDIIMEARPDAEVVDNPATGGMGYLIDGEIYTPGEADEKFAGGQWKQTGGWLSKKKTAELDQAKLDDIWENMNDSERFGVQFGMFPSWIDPDQQSVSHEEIVRLMEMASQKSAKSNPIGKVVEIKDGPDAGLTGLVSRKGDGGWFIEIEGMESGPYKVSSLKSVKTATKKTAEFAEGEEVFIEVDGEMIKGVVLSDDGGSQVEVGDPEDDPYMVGAPAMVDRDRIFRDLSGRDWSTAKKVANADKQQQEDLIYNLKGLMDVIDGNYYGEEATPRDIEEFGNTLEQIGQIMGNGDWLSSVQTRPHFDRAVELWNQVGDRKIVWT